MNFWSDRILRDPYVIDSVILTQFSLLAVSMPEKICALFSRIWTMPSKCITLIRFIALTCAGGAICAILLRIGRGGH
jgi:hypothetical protein